MVGGLVLIKNRGKGGVFRGGGVGGERALGECLWGEGGGGLNIFFGPEIPTKQVIENTIGDKTITYLIFIPAEFCLANSMCFMCMPENF